MQRNGKVVVMLDDKVGVYEDSIWSLFITQVAKIKRGFKPNKEVKNAKQIAKLCLYHTFYEHLLTYPLTRYEITSRDCEKIVFFDKAFQGIIDRKDRLLQSFKEKLQDLGLERFVFLYELASADEAFSRKLFDYCRSKTPLSESYDVV